MAVRSLLEQDLPEGAEWAGFWIVASGCTDGTVQVAGRLATEDPRIHVLVEPERRGKAHAVRQVFDRAQGSALVLLNADARAEAGAVRALLRVAGEHPAPFAVMAHPVVPADTVGRWTEELRLMWSLHHEFHLELQRLGGGAHLSDELLLVSLPEGLPLPEGTINDGSYFGVWLSQHGAPRLYAPDAKVTIDVPWSIRDHLEQRRRILYGNGQVTAALGAAPSTLVRYALRSPSRAIRLVRRSDQSDGESWIRLARLAAVEAAATTLALWDRFVPRADHVRWRRIRSTPPVGLLGPSAARPTQSWAAPDAPAVLEGRVSTIVCVASEFGTGVALPELLRLLPEEAPATVPEVRRWLETRPHLARLEGERAFAPESATVARRDRTERGGRYLRHAQTLFGGPLRGALPWTRCVCVTGSAAYGEPKRGDDLDLFVVTRRGTLWWFLAYAYLGLRIARIREPTAGEPVPCFNFVVEEADAAKEFAEGQGFLFAREALTARPVSGARFYEGLLSDAPWMAEEIPRLYAERDRSPDPPEIEPLPSPLAIRVLNAAVFPWLAAYLQLAGLFRNARYRRASRHDDRFGVETRWRRLALTSRKFERLRAAYGQPVTGRVEAAQARGKGSRLPISESPQ